MTSQSLEEWRAWAYRPIPPDVLDIYERWRAEHGLGFDDDPGGVMARYWWLGRESLSEK